MTVGFVVALMRGGVLQILIMALPILLVGMGVGLIVSILQATTSIQEQTLTFVPKIAAILLALMLLSPFLVTGIREYTIDLFQKIPELAQ